MTSLFCKFWHTFWKKTFSHTIDLTTLSHAKIFFEHLPKDISFTRKKRREKDSISLFIVLIFSHSVSSSYSAYSMSGSSTRVKIVAIRWRVSGSCQTWKTTRKTSAPCSDSQTSLRKSLQNIDGLVQIARKYILYYPKMMPETLKYLIDAFAKLPGVGEKNSNETRISYPHKEKRTHTRALRKAYQCLQKYRYMSSLWCSQGYERAHVQLL